MSTTGDSPARLLEKLSDRLGTFEAIAYSTLKLARYVPEEEFLMNLLVSETILEIGEDLRETPLLLERLLICAIH